MGLQIGVDIGGTFTDIVAVEEGTIRTEKVPTTPADLVAGIRDGIQGVLDGEGANLSRFVHGTTVGTNAVIEREGGTVGVLMTKGFRDTLEIGRENRREIYDLFIDEQTPTFLAPRKRRLEVDERVDAEGQVLAPLDEDEVREAVRTLVDEHDVDTIAICYLFSFLNPEHERRTEQLIAEEYPEVYVSRSSAVDPEFREYERLVVTTVDAYLKPVVNRYIERIETEAIEGGLPCDLQIMQSRGGITNAELVAEQPVTTLVSGPAAAVSGASKLGAAIGYGNLVTLDIGGTSSDVSIVTDGAPSRTNTGRLLEYPIRTPMVDVTTIGAGGGSIAWLDDTGSLHVGPESAGAMPGPACYGRGGTEPTVTDASLVMGFFDPEHFAGGSLELDAGVAESVVEETAGDPLGYDPVTAARGIHRIVNAKMAEQLRLQTVEQGIDPRDYAMFAMGGAGPIHAGKLAAELNIGTVIVPPTPGVLSARGLLTADIEHEHNATFRGRLSEVEPADIEAAFQTLVEQGDDAMAREGVEGFQVTRQADIRYVGQSFEIALEFPNEAVTEDVLAETRERFHERHRQKYGHENPDDPVEFVTLRVVHTYTPPSLEDVYREPGESLSHARRKTSLVSFPDVDGPVETAIYERSKLPFDVGFDGPAVIEQEDTTTVVYPGQRGAVDERGNVFIHVE